MTAPINYRAYAQAYAEAHGTMTPATIDGVVDLCSEGIKFHDPFNDTIGKTELRHLFLDMFKSTKDPRTEVLGLFGGRRRWIIKWRFRAGIPVIGALDVMGLTELTLGEDGRVQEHIDYWDSGPAIYGKLPVIGFIVRKARHRLSAKSRR